jgi:hypothetical protein
MHLKVVHLDFYMLPALSVHFQDLDELGYLA